MEVPTEVLIHNELMSFKGTRATLLQIHSHGFYEARIRFGEKAHRVLLPVVGTVVISQEPDEEPGFGEQIER